jgi:hydrogenase-4 component E
VLVLLLNFFVLGTSRLKAIVNGTATQGVLLGVVGVLVNSEVSAESILIAAGAALIKGLLIPLLLARAMRDVAIRREVEPLIGYIPSLFACAVGTGASIVFAGTLPLGPEHARSLLVPASLATIFTGFLVLTTRLKAITQVAGYLIFENGIFIFGLGLVEAMPRLVEIGVILDLLVAIFVMGIMIHQINREFASLDTDRMAHLKD